VSIEMMRVYAKIFAMSIVRAGNSTTRDLRGSRVVSKKLKKAALIIGVFIVVEALLLWACLSSNNLTLYIWHLWVVALFAPIAFIVGIYWGQNS